MSNDLSALGGLSLERLRSFCLIAEAGSFVAAADRNPVRQSQFSRQIKDLEKALGTKLFARDGKRLKLTVEGVRLAGVTNAYFSALNELHDDVVGGAKPLRLGAAESIVRWLLIPRFPEVLAAGNGTLDVQTHRTAEIVELLENGRLDVGIIRADVDGDTLERLSFPAMRFVLMVPRSRLPGKSAAGINETKVLPCVMLSGDGRFVKCAEAVAEANGLTLVVRARVESFSLAVEIAKMLDAAVFVPVQAKVEFLPERYAPVELKKAALLERALTVVFSRKTAELNERARRFASRLSRAYESTG